MKVLVSNEKVALIQSQLEAIINLDIKAETYERIRTTIISFWSMEIIKETWNKMQNVNEICNTRITINKSPWTA